MSRSRTTEQDEVNLR